MGCLPSRSSTTVSPADETTRRQQQQQLAKNTTAKKRSTPSSMKPAANGYMNSSTNTDTATDQPKRNSTTNKKRALAAAAAAATTPNGHLEPGGGRQLEPDRDPDPRHRVRAGGAANADGNPMSGEGADREEEEEEADDIMSILMNEQDKYEEEEAEDNGGGGGPRPPQPPDSKVPAAGRVVDQTGEGEEEEEEDGEEGGRMTAASSTDTPASQAVRGAKSGDGGEGDGVGGDDQQGGEPASNLSSFVDEELNLELLRQYIVVDYEITQLENKDALRIYHEKIEQLEQLERELDMISSEAAEVAARSEHHLEMAAAGAGAHASNAQANARRLAGGGGDAESNSLLSGASLSPRSSLKARTNLASNGNSSTNKQISNAKNKATATTGEARAPAGTRAQQAGEHETAAAAAATTAPAAAAANPMSAAYSTVEEVFNRKIILEKERDKLKKEVELVIVECDKLQQRYKRRDEILDKLFDGKTGNGLENHLEQQLNWLMEQKHYVDQVFYAWKRAETLTSQTCEQFASALNLLKRLAKMQQQQQHQPAPTAGGGGGEAAQQEAQTRAELAASIGQLLIKSRQDMEQAQRYNPNVDAPFFTDNETEKFDKIIETISAPAAQISQSEYSQIATVIQFAYKRAVSIRLWLEQILQITIARDSFELAEEYKWIAIQLRKERITLIKSKLQEPPYRSLVASIQEQLAKQAQQHQQQLSVKSSSAARDEERGQLRAAGKQAATNTTTTATTNEFNRDSGIESDDIDIEEEIYRLLEMNKSRLEAAIGQPHRQPPAAAGEHQTGAGVGGGDLANGQQQQQQQQHRTPTDDQMMRDRIQRRVRGEQPLASTSVRGPPAMESAVDVANSVGSPTTTSATTQHSQTLTTGSATPSKLRVELDEATRQNLLKQVDQVHSKHRSKMERLRGDNKAKASDSISNRMRQARSKQQQEGGSNNNTKNAIES